MMGEESKHHETAESTNRNGKNNKKEDFERNDQANISEIENETKTHNSDLQMLSD